LICDNRSDIKRKDNKTNDDLILLKQELNDQLKRFDLIVLKISRSKNVKHEVISLLGLQDPTDFHGHDFDWVALAILLFIHHILEENFVDMHRW
jgi:hypothetical protein